jgi:hypothetical protein
MKPNLPPSERIDAIEADSEKFNRRLAAVERQLKALAEIAVPAAMKAIHAELEVSRGEPPTL